MKILFSSYLFHPSLGGIEAVSKILAEKFAAAEIPAAPINTVAEAIEDKQTHARGLIVQLEHPAIGTAKSIANPIRFSNTPVSYRLPPPLLAEHTREILHSLGYSADDVQAMGTESAI